MTTKTSNIMARVEPAIKEQAEAVLSQLGISMSTAMTIFLRQIALHQKIPFEMALPPLNRPTVLSTLSDNEFDALIEKSLQSVASNKCRPIGEFKTELLKEISNEQ